MTIKPEQLRAFTLRSEEIAQQVARLISIGAAAAQDLPDDEPRIYMRTSYDIAKAILTDCLRDGLAGAPAAAPLSRVDGFAIQDGAESLNKTLGYIRDLAKGLLAEPATAEDGTVIASWTDEQRQAIEAEIETKAQQVRDALAALP